MSVHEVNRPPSPETILSVIDKGTRESILKAQQAIAPIVTRETPKRSGRTAAALRPRISRVASGYALGVKAPRGKSHGGQATIVDVIRWLNRGTGVYREGPGPKRRIRAKNPLHRMTLPGGIKRWSVKGQHPNHFMARIEALSTPHFQQAAEEGAQETARLLQRTIGS